jgi:hypothetical protein
MNCDDQVSVNRVSNDEWLARNARWQLRRGERDFWTISRQCETPLGMFSLARNRRTINAPVYWSKARRGTNCRSVRISELVSVLVLSGIMPTWISNDRAHRMGHLGDTKRRPHRIDCHPLLARRGWYVIRSKGLAEREGFSNAIFGQVPTVQQLGHQTCCTTMV